MLNNYFTNFNNMSSLDAEHIQLPQMRKYILRSAVEAAKQLNANVDKNTITNLEHVMDKTDIISSKINVNEIVNNHEEVILDAHVISLSSHIMQKCSLNVTDEINNYAYDEFAEKLKTYLIRLSNTHVDEPNWSLLENQVSKIFKTFPKYTSLQGCMDPIPVKEKVKRESHREAKVPVKRPKCITEPKKAEESVEDSVQKIVHLVNEYYEKNEEPLPFFKLVIHPTNFGRTVENLLHTSFLFRDGILKLVKNESGALFVEIVPKKVLHAVKKARKQIGIQNIFSINIHDWKILREAYKIKKPMIV